MTLPYRLVGIRTLSCNLPAQGVQKEPSKRDLRDQNQRDTDGKFPVLRLVANGVHPQKAADAAANGGNRHQCRLRDAPFIFSRPVLVRKHKKEAQRIDYKEVKYQIFHKIIPLGGVNVKKCWLLGMLVLLLTGCAAEETFETVADELVAQVSAQTRQTYVELPEEAASPAVESDSGRIYLCENYEITVQTVDGGDLSATVRYVSGYDMEDLTVMHTQKDGTDTYEFVWASMAEPGERVGRAKILDDGSFHYVLTVMGDADTAQSNLPVWLSMFDSFSLA